MKTALKILNTGAYLGLNWCTGYAAGKILSIIASKILTEKLAEEHTVLFWMLFVLYIVLLAVAAIGIGLMDPWHKLYDWINKKIDRQEEEQNEFFD